MIKSEKLGLKWDGKARVKVPSRSGMIWQPFAEWWDIFDLNGDGLLVGEEYKDSGVEVKDFFSKIQKGEGKILLSSIIDSDVNWDITQPYAGLTSPFEFDWIICQAVLEHVKDPVRAVQNLVEVLKPSGFLYLHSHGPAFKEHRHPIDCWRFLRDGVLALADQSGARTVDFLYTEKHWFLLLQKVM
jgi:SAM-dependent methyltransferase